MSYARWSFIYLATYLVVTGVGFLFAPQFSLRLLGASGHYEVAFVQFVGAFMIALGTIVIQIMRYRLEMLYRTTVAIRLFFIAVIIGLYRSTDDPLFLVILAVVSLGVLLTTAGLVADWRRRLPR
jgi:uncharacterized protein YjeT (DUF2065 family)